MKMLDRKKLQGQSHPFTMKTGRQRDSVFVFSSKGIYGHSGMIVDR